MKFSDILASASHNLWRNKSRTILTIIAIFIGAFTISLTTAVNTGVNDYIDKQVGIFGTNKSILEISKAQNMEMMGSSDSPTEYNPDQSSNAMGMTLLNNNDVKKIQEVKGIKEAKGWKTAFISYIQGKNDKKFTLNARSSYDGMVLDTKAGRPIDMESNTPEINIPSSYVKSLGYENDEEALNKEVVIAVKNSATGEMKTTKAKIVGVLNKSFMQSMTAFYNTKSEDEIYDLQTSGVPDSMKDNYIAVMAVLEDGYEEGDKLQEVKKNLSDIEYAGATIEDQIGMFRDIINAITGALTLFGAIALLAASFGIINTLYMSVQERTREIGLFKAMGLSSGKVFAMFSIEAVLIGFWGSVIGYGIAILAGGALNSLASETFLKGMEGFSLTMFNLESALIVCGIIMLIAFLSGTLPSRRAAKQDPIDALRYE